MLNHPYFNKGIQKSLQSSHFTSFVLFKFSHIDPVSSLITYPFSFWSPKTSPSLRALLFCSPTPYYLALGCHMPSVFLCIIFRVRYAEFLIIYCFGKLIQLN